MIVQPGLPGVDTVEFGGGKEDFALIEILAHLFDFVGEFAGEVLPFFGEVLEGAEHMTAEATGEVSRSGVSFITLLIETLSGVADAAAVGAVGVVPDRNFGVLALAGSGVNDAAGMMLELEGFDGGSFGDGALEESGGDAEGGAGAGDFVDD